MERNVYNPRVIQVISEDLKARQAKFISKVYGWMSLALLLTGLVAYFVSAIPGFINVVVTNQPLFFFLIIAELGLVVWISARITKMNITTAVSAFLVYSVLNGITLSLIFLIYTSSSIALTFFITAGTFAVMSVYGYFTNADLTRVGKIFTMLLVGIVIASLVNIFVKSSAMYWLITYIGVAIFVGLIAYDTQKIKNYFLDIDGNEKLVNKVAIIGALSLYLDFINLFLFLLRLFGGSRNN